MFSKTFTLSNRIKYGDNVIIFKTVYVAFSLKKSLKNCFPEKAHTRKKHVMVIFFDFLAVSKCTCYALMLVVITNYGIHQILHVFFYFI